MAVKASLWERIVASDAYRAASVAILSVLTALAAYAGSVVQIGGDDLDIDAHNSLIKASTVYLSGNSIILKDIKIYTKRFGATTG